MTEYLLPGGVLVASLAMTYYFCLRPMRRGHCGPGEKQHATHDELELALQQARLDLARLRAGMTDKTGTPAGQPPSPSVLGDESVTSSEQPRGTLPRVRGDSH